MLTSIHPPSIYIDAMLDNIADIIGLPLILHFQLGTEETSAQMKPCFNLL